VKVQPQPQQVKASRKIKKSQQVMYINNMDMGEESLSKKWRLAQKAGIFNGSFKEFADLYNQKIDENGEVENFNDDASQSNTTQVDLSPVNTSGMKGKILGMTPPTLIIVSVIGVLLIGTGIVLFVRSGKTEEAS